MSRFEREGQLKERRQGEEGRYPPAAEADGKEHQQDRSLGEDVKHKAKDTARQVGDEAKEAAGEIGDEAKKVARDATREVKKLAGETRTALFQSMTENKGVAASELANVAGALQATGAHLRESSSANIAPYAEELGNHVDRAARYLRDRELGAMVSDLEGFAKREPGLFIGGAVAIGLLASRFLKSSADASETSSDGEQFPSDGGSGRAYSSSAAAPADPNSPGAYRHAPDTTELAGEPNPRNADNRDEGR